MNNKILYYKFNKKTKVKVQKSDNFNKCKKKGEEC